MIANGFGLNLNNISSSPDVLFENKLNERNLTFNLLDPNQIRLTLCYTNCCPTWCSSIIFFHVVCSAVCVLMLKLYSAICDVQMVIKYIKISPVHPII